jgi:tetratricopeptide (TPR) repeat protein
MRFFEAAVASALALAILGCASPSPDATGDKGAAPAQNAPRAAAADAAKPESDLSGPLLFQLMAAEVALQKGDVATAFATYISVARQTRDARVARRATEIAIGGRLLPQALEASQLWSQLAPQDSEAAQAMAALLVANNRYDEAAKIFTEQLKQAADPLPDIARIQRALARVPDRPAGFALLERVAQPYAADPKIGADVRLILAAGAQAAGNTQKAIDHVQGALALRPDFERAALAAAQLQLQARGPDGAEDAAGRDRALALLADFVGRQPGANEARLMYARLLVAANRLPDARAQFSQLLARDVGNLDAMYALAVLALDQPLPRVEAKQRFEEYLRALEKNPGSGRDPDAAYLNLARIAEDEKRYDEALDWLERVDGGEQFLNARMRRALVLGKMKKVDEARKLLADTPVNGAEERAQITLAEGQVLRDARRYREAFDVLAQGLARSPDDSGLLYDAAMAAEKLDRIDAMERHLRRLIELKPKEAHAYNALGYSLADRNLRLAEARALIEKALAISPDDGYIIDSMGWVLFRQGDLPKAREYLERAYKLKPEGEVAAHLGEVMWVQGDRDGARRVWREAIKREPDNESLRATLARLKVRL